MSKIKVKRSCGDLLESRIHTQAYSERQYLFLTKEGGKWHLWNSCQVKLLYLSSIWLFSMVGSKIELPIQHKFLWGRNWKRHTTVSSYLWWSDVIGSGHPEYFSISPLIDYFAHCITEIWDTNSAWIKIGLTMSRLRVKIKGLQFQDGLHIFT